MRGFTVAGAALAGRAIVGNSVPGYDATFWLGIVAPKNTPADMSTNSTRINVALADPGMIARLAETKSLRR
jgi:hypothetical protein